MRLEAEVQSRRSGAGARVSSLRARRADERNNLEEGYCLWLGSQNHPSCRLFRNNVQVMEAKSLFLQPKTWHHIRIEKVDDHLKFFLDGKLKLSFASHLPLAGTHVGLLHKDDDFELKNCSDFTTAATT